MGASVGNHGCASRIEELLAADPTLRNKELADKLGVSIRHVSRLRSQVNMPGKSARPRTWTEEALAQAKELLDDGAGYREASATTHIPRTTLRGRFPGMGMSSSEAGKIGVLLARMPEAERFQLTQKIRLD